MDIHPDMYWRRKFRGDAAIRLICLAFAFIPCAVFAQHGADMGSMSASDPAFNRDRAREISNAALNTRLPRITLVDSRGVHRSLTEFEGKPLVISMIYTSCYHICPTTTRHLDSVVDKARDALGDSSFNVISVGFDTVRDTPPMMDRFRQEQHIEDPNWTFLSGDSHAVKQLADTLGFLYTPAQGGFNHLIQTTVVDGEGAVYQQVYGIDFDAPQLIEPLKRLVFKTDSSDGLLSSLSKQVRLFCTVYDPTSDRYRFDYSLYIGTFIGMLCVLLVGIFLFHEWRKTLTHRRTGS